MCRSGFITLLIVCMELCTPTLANETEKPLTNADLLQMLRAGVPEGTVLLTIESASWRGNVQLDASPSALVELRKQGATEQILNAVLEMEAAQKARTAREKALAGRPLGLPTRHGVYYRGTPGWISLPSFFLWPPMLSRWNGFRYGAFGAWLQGPQAQFQLLDVRPTFHVPSAQVAEEWQLLHLARKGDHREVRVVHGASYPWHVGIDARALREIEITPLGGEVLSIRPRSELEPGEYLVCGSVPGGRGLFRCYEFGVALEKPSGQPGARTPS